MDQDQCQERETCSLSPHVDMNRTENSDFSLFLIRWNMMDFKCSSVKLFHVSLSDFMRLWGFLWGYITRTDSPLQWTVSAVCPLSVRPSVLLMTPAAVTRGHAAVVVERRFWTSSCEAQSSSADQCEPVELQGPQQSGPQVALPRGHQGDGVHRDGGVPETQHRDKQTHSHWFTLN